MRAAVLALSGAIALGGCASDKLTLSENEEGEATGAVAILDPVTNEDKAVIDTKMTEAKLVNRPKPRAVKKLTPAYIELLKNLPLKSDRITIFFEPGKQGIPPSEIGKVNDIRKAIEIRSGAQIEVVGFTDTQDSDENNAVLSANRAISVIKELIAMGLPVDLEDAVGRGEREARANGDPDNFENPKYRKVEVVVR